LYKIQKIGRSFVTWLYRSYTVGCKLVWLHLTYFQIWQLVFL